MYVVLGNVCSFVFAVVCCSRNFVLLCTTAAAILCCCVLLSIFVNRAGSLDVCRVVIVMGIIRAILFYVGLVVLAMYSLMVILCSCQLLAM